MSDQKYITELVVTLENDIEFKFVIWSEVLRKNMNWFDNAETVNDIEEILKQHHVKYELQVSQYGVRIAVPDDDDTTDSD